MKNFGVYANGFYLFNPMNTNGVERNTTNPYSKELSVADQYLGRGGLYYGCKKAGLLFNAGIRMEGVPAKDVIGKDEGFRRPGYIFSIESGVIFQR